MPQRFGARVTELILALDSMTRDEQHEALWYINGVMQSWAKKNGFFLLGSDDDTIDINAFTHYLEEPCDNASGTQPEKPVSP